MFFDQQKILRSAGFLINICINRFIVKSVIWEQFLSIRRKYIDQE